MNTKHKYIIIVSRLDFKYANEPKRKYTIGSFVVYYIYTSCFYIFKISKPNIRCSCVFVLLCNLHLNHSRTTTTNENYIKFSIDRHIKIHLWTLSPENLHETSFLNKLNSGHADNYMWLNFFMCRVLQG